MASIHKAIALCVFVSITLGAQTNDYYRVDSAVLENAFNYITFTNDFSNGYLPVLHMEQRVSNDSLFTVYRYEIYERHTAYCIHSICFTNVEQFRIETNVIVEEEAFPWWAVSTALALGILAGIAFE